MKYPDITVRLTGTDGNAFAVLGTVRRALQTAAVEPDEIDAFYAEAASGDYDHLLTTCMAWVDVE
ncbi:MAG: hypothetical protein FWD74_00655 [Actinomycetia bacterium]|nr:hypothetical protein [Actinomycetes bacterium]